MTKIIATFIERTELRTRSPGRKAPFDNSVSAADDVRNIGSQR